MNKTIYASVLLKDNKIISYRISPNKKEKPSDFYKDFIYSEYKDWSNCDNEFEVQWMGFEFNDNDDKESYRINNYIFNNIAKEFFKMWEIHPEHFGDKPY